jgi:hypothetical protein
LSAQEPRAKAARAKAARRRVFRGCGKVKKRQRRQRKPSIEPVIVTAEPKTVMQLIFEAQRTELDRLNGALRTKVFESLDF